MNMVFNKNKDRFDARNEIVEELKKKRFSTNLKYISTMLAVQKGQML